MGIGMLAMQKQFDTLNQMVADFQSIYDANQNIKTPVASRHSRLRFGRLRTLCTVILLYLTAESYIGLVEVGSLIPGGEVQKNLP